MNIYFEVKIRYIFINNVSHNDPNPRVTTKHVCMFGRSAVVFILRNISIRDWVSHQPFCLCIVVE